MERGILRVLGLFSRGRTLAFSTQSSAMLRGQVASRLIHSGGRHVIFVRYGADHSFHDEWVYNAANIDGSAIVWCRATTPPDEAEVVRYYSDRMFWVASVSPHRVRVSRYRPGFDTNESGDSPGIAPTEWVLED